MTKVVHVGNLPYECTEEDLSNHFKKVGTIENIILERKEDGTSKGFGFVSFQTPEQAEKAIDDFDDTVFMRRIIHVTPRSKSPRRYKGVSVLDEVEMRSPPKTIGDSPKKGKEYSSDSESSKPRRHHHHHHHHHRHHHNHHHHHDYSSSSSSN